MGTAATTAITTIEESGLVSELLDRPTPGMVLMFTEGKARCTPIRLDGGPIEIGRVAADGMVVLSDDRVSRRHTRVTLRADGVHVADLDSRNGTFVDGRRVRAETFARLPRLLRVGQSLFLFVNDIRLFFRGGVEVSADEVVGPTLRKSRDSIVRAAIAGESMLLTGPSGSGKELAARAYHAAWSKASAQSSREAAGPFVAVNCATIPAGLAERLLFGARRGAYSGANADAEGYVQSADGGTLFLDEVAELDLSVQPKLLRVLELKEVVALGAAHPRKVDVRLCAATLKDLRGEVQAGRFREDLYYRIGRPEVRLPALVERLEDLPYLVQRELSRVDPRLTAHPSIIEGAALRPWPGNVRELLSEIRRAAREALADGRTSVKDRDLSPAAGLEIAVESRTAAESKPGIGISAPSTGSIRPSSPPEPRRADTQTSSSAVASPRLPAPPAPPSAQSVTPAPSRGDLPRDVIEAALRREQGNVTRAARTLGWHRNQLRRWITKNNVDPKTFGSGSDDDAIDADDSD